MAADVGTLQRLPKVVGNESLVRELAFSARKMHADEAKECGLVSRVFPDKTRYDSNYVDCAKWPK
jgi:Delta3,5-Delta2,4-dienoyl-CoA isomerase